MLVSRIFPVRAAPESFGASSVEQRDDAGVVGGGAPAVAVILRASEAIDATEWDGTVSEVVKGKGDITVYREH